MLHTTELRWFFRDEVPAEVEAWVRHGDLWVEQPERVDEYLVLPGCSSAGIKLREGLFEVKVQTAAPVAVGYPNDVRGYRDQWVKWSRALGGVRTDSDFRRAEGERWVPVRKRRLLRGFSLDQLAAEETPREVAVDGRRPARGCGVEITMVTVEEAAEEERWWTLGLEGFDDGGDPTGALERVARALFERRPPPLLLALEDSKSYAAWLADRQAANR